MRPSLHGRQSDDTQRSVSQGVLTASLPGLAKSHSNPGYTLNISAPEQMNQLQKSYEQLVKVKGSH